MLHSQVIGNGLCSSGKMECGTLAGEALYFDFFPRDTVLDSGAQCFGSSLFCGKSGGEAFGKGNFSLAEGDFFWRIYPAEKAIAEALDGMGDALDFDQIHASTNEHGGTLPQRRSSVTRMTLYGHEEIAIWTDVTNVLDADTSLRWNLELVAASAEEPARTIRFLSGALMACGAWIVMRRFYPEGTAELEFEFARGLCVDIYAVLMSAGMELSRDSHIKLAELCNCTKNVIETKVCEMVQAELTVLIAVAVKQEGAGDRV